MAGDACLSRLFSRQLTSRSFVFVFVFIRIGLLRGVVSGGCSHLNTCSWLSWRAKNTVKIGYDQCGKTKELNKHLETIAERAPDLEDRQIGRLEARRSGFDHLRQQQSLNVAFDEHGGIGEKEITMRELEVALEKRADFGIGAVVEGGEIKNV